MQQPHIVLFGFPIRFGIGAMILTGFATMYFQLMGLGLAFAFLGSVLVHELGHAFAFRRYGCSSSIVLNAFGGYTASYDAHHLTHRQHVIVSAAGPLVQLGLLGLPSLVVWRFVAVDGILALALPIYVFLNVGWALVNLLPLYPLDGGQILFHELLHRRVRNAWDITKWAAIGFGVPLGLLALRMGFTFGALLIGYTIYKGISTGGPRATATANNPIREAAERARAEHKPVDTAGKAGDELVEEARQQLAGGGRRRFSIIVDSLATNGGREADVASLKAWESALDGQLVAPAGAASPLLTQTVAVVVGAEPAALQTALNHGADSRETLLALALLSQHDRLDTTLAGLDQAALTDLVDQAVVAGMLTEQQAIRRALAETS